MATRSNAFTTALVGGVIGLAILGAIYAFAEQWYASSLSPVILVLSPGALVGLFNPASPAVYWVLVLIVQAVTYALAALAIRLLFQRAARRGSNAV